MAGACEGKCKRLGPPRRGAVRGRCETCDTWVDRRDARLKDGSQATESAADWYCACCGERMEQFPKATAYRKSCVGECRRFRAPGRAEGGRYAQGHIWCRVCAVWMSRDGARLSDGSPAAEGTHGWYCACCGTKVRRASKNARKAAA